MIEHLTRVDVERLRELLDDGTPGEWRTASKLAADGSEWEVCDCGGFGESPNEHTKVVTTCEDYCRPAEDDAALIAAMHEFLPALLDIAERYLAGAEGVVAPYPEANDRATFLYFNGQGEVPQGEERVVPAEERAAIKACHTIPSTYCHKPDGGDHG